MTSAKSPLVFHRYDYAAFLTFIAYAASSVIIPVVLVQLARNLHFPLEKSGGMSLGGMLHMGRSFAMVAALLASGFIAGRFGVRRTMGTAILLMALGIGLCAFTPTYGLLFIGLLTAGLGEGYLEAIGTPFVQMLHPADTGRYMNFTHGFWSVGMFGTVLTAGYALVLGVNWRIIVGTVVVLALIPALMLLLPQSPGHEFPEHSERMDARSVWCNTVRIMKVCRFWVFFAAIFLAGGGEFCLTFWLASFMQISMHESAFMGGFATAAFAGGMAVGRTAFGVFVPQNRLFTLLTGCAAGGIVTGLLIPLLRPGIMPAWALLILLFLLLFLIGVATAPYWPTLQTYCIDRLPARLDTTLIFVLMSIAGVPGCGVFTLLMGIAGDFWGMTASFYLVPLCYFVMLILILYDYFFPLQKKESKPYR